MSDFLKELEKISWLAKLGKPSPHDASVKRIKSFKDWGGPEGPGATALNAYIYNQYQKIVGQDKELEALLKKVESAVKKLAKTKVDYDPEGDAWDGPTACVNQTAWFAGLIGCAMHKDSGLKAEFNSEDQISLPSLWWWYKNGHWPCDITGITEHIQDNELDNALKNKALIVL